MKFYLNGTELEISHLSQPINIKQVLSHALAEKKQQQSFALALNGEFIGKDDYTSTEVKESDSIDVLFPIVGG